MYVVKEHVQQFINKLAKQLVGELRVASRLNTRPCAKRMSVDTKSYLMYKRAFCNYL